MDDIALAPYDPAWPDAFERELDFLRALLGVRALTAIYHIGSTAVPGLSAKPVIDMMGVVGSLKQAPDSLVLPLASAGYTFWAKNPDLDRLFFVKGLPPLSPHRTHHLHLVEEGPELVRHLNFRDILLGNDDARRKYEALKINLATEYSHDREAYTDAKASLIADILRENA